MGYKKSAFLILHTHTRICDIRKDGKLSFINGPLALIILRRCQTRAAYNENELQRF